MKPKVAIVTRTKNRPLLLGRALSSILNQTMSDFVLVIVNDSPDREPVDRLVESFESKIDGRLVFVQNERAEGRWGAMNAGIDAVDSEYFILHDDDDSWHPDFLLRTTAYLDSHPEDAAVGTRCEIINEEISGGAVTELSREVLATNLSELSLLQTLRQNYVPPIALLLRREVFDVIGRFDDSLPVLADWEFNLRLLSRFTAGFIDGEPLAYWHQRESAAGDEGNSVIAESNKHQMFNLMIRDTYLRKSLAEQDDLGPLLLTAELFRQLDGKADDARREQARVRELWHTNHRNHLEMVQASLMIEVNRLQQTTIELQEKIHSLIERIEREPSLAEELKGIAKGVTRPFRRRGNRSE